ncbi:hypothetical protein GCM10010451_52520 [Streptomyces virens]|uniref:Uncharacterized protein n=1 Tax=Streptomyces virens TaxID=285572 RepID=A0ABP6PYC6_9ACTN
MSVGLPAGRTPPSADEAAEKAEKTEKAEKATARRPGQAPGAAARERNRG